MPSCTNAWAAILTIEILSDLSGLRLSLTTVGLIPWTVAHHTCRYELFLSNRLSGKKAVITAAAQGIGRATAIAFADEGATVWATDVNEVGLLDLSRERSEIVTRRVDVRDSQAVASLAQETGPIDVLFNCAG